MKRVMGERLNTVFPRQGHYALDAREVAAYPEADFTVECIGELVGYSVIETVGAPWMLCRG